MNRWLASVAAASLIAILSVGCAGSNRNPVSPDGQQERLQDLTAGADRTAQAGPVLWGYYDFFVDIENRKIEAVPNRSVGFSANVVKFLNNDPAGLQVKFNGTSPGAGYIDIDMDITIKHPLSDHEYDGYDVRGIFIGNGSVSLEYNTDLICPVSGTDQILLNADGYTRWFNPTEFFIPKIFGYIPGKLASKDYTGTATLNPYKYFGEHFGATDNLWEYLSSGNANVGYFLAGTSDTRNYIIRFPIPLPGVKYGYAVVANWSGAAPQFHPSHAPEGVGVSIVDNSDVWYVDDTHKGGDLVLDITVFDWDAELTGGVMEDYAIYIESTVLSAPCQLDAAEMTPTGGSENWSTYHVEIPADNVTGTEGNEMWVVVEDSNADYTNPLGVPNSADGDKVAACFRYPLAVSSDEPLWIQVTSPNGGEEWEVGSSHEITWEAHQDIQNVAIGLSLNSGANFTYLVAASTPNDGSFTWDPIPYDAYGAHDRIKIKDVDNSAVYDVSDADFTIVQPSITVLSPNGGEEWRAGHDEEIDWGSYAVTGNVDILYSKDNFTSDVHDIALDEPNDGSFMWNDIPNDPSNTVRVKIESTDDPGIFDVSDNDFVLTDGGWVQTWDAGTVDLAMSVAVDADDNIYVGGYGGPSYSEIQAFVRKFDLAGQLVWERNWGSPGGASVTGMTVDDDGFIYVVGKFVGTDVDFDPGPGTDLHSASDSGDAFVCKYDSSGTYSWGYNWGGSDPSGENAATAVAVASPDLYVAGAFCGTNVDFNPSQSGTDLHSSNGMDDAFLSQFNTSGVHAWTGTWGGDDWDFASGVAVGNAGRVFVTGMFISVAVDFDPDALDEYYVFSNGGADVFLSWFDSQTFTGCHTWGGSDNDSGECVAVDGLGNVFAAGSFSSADVDFDTGPGSDPHSSAGEGDAFLSKFNSSLSFQWARTWGGQYGDVCNAVAADASGNAFVSGYYSDSIDFDPGPGIDQSTSNGEHDAYWSRFDPLGNYAMAQTWGGAGSDEAWSVSVLGSRSLCAGSFANVDVEFAPVDAPCFDDSDAHSATGDFDSFLVKYMPDGCW